MSILVLEEALGVKTLTSKKFSELVLEVGNNLVIILGGLGDTVEGLSSGIIERHVNVLLEMLLGEDLIDRVREVSPSDLLGLLSLEVVSKALELAATEDNLCHV